jgi:uncharacterized protein YbjT (DUF2867 family)
LIHLLGEANGMKLLLLGATGRTGRWTLEYALEAGHHAVALVRNPGKVVARSRKLSVVVGTPENANDVRNAMAGCDAVVSTLNNNRTSDLPWARPVSPPMFIARSIRNAIAAMRATAANRIVVLSAVGVGDSFAYAPAITRLLIRTTNLHIVFEDHEAQEAALRESALNWTCVRAAILKNARSRGKLVVSYGGQPKPGLTIGRERVAQFMIDILQDPAFFRKSPVISERSF